MSKRLAIMTLAFVNGCLLTACGSQAPHVKAQATSEAVAELAAAPLHLKAAITKTGTLVTWTRTDGVDGYSLYVDQNSAISLPRDATSYRLKAFASGSSHFIQLGGLRNGELGHLAQDELEVPVREEKESSSDPSAVAGVTGTPTNSSAGQGGAGSSGTSSAPQASGLTLRGTVTVKEISQTIVGIVTGDPNNTMYSSYADAEFAQHKKILNRISNGRTYKCPLGAGGGYSDLVPGGQVSIKNETGTLIATTALTGGTLSEQGCSFDFTASGLPSAAFYSVEVTHRGSVNYSRQQLDASNWRVFSSVG